MARLVRQIPIEMSHPACKGGTGQAGFRQADQNLSE
jgi:hypothetical protein